MKAIRFERYGLPEVLELADIEMPAVGDDEVLVWVRAAPVNRLDWHFMWGAPYLVRMVFFRARQDRADLAVLRELAETGKVTPVIDWTYSLSEAAEAIRYLEQGRAKGKSSSPYESF